MGSDCGKKSTTYGKIIITIMGFIRAMIVGDRFFPCFECEDFPSIMRICEYLHHYTLIGDIIHEYIDYDEDLITDFIIFILENYKQEPDNIVIWQIIFAFTEIHNRSISIFRNAIDEILTYKVITRTKLRTMGRRLGILSNNDPFETDFQYFNFVPN